MTQPNPMYHPFFNIASNTFWKTIDLIAQYHSSFARKYYTRYIGNEYIKEYLQFQIKESDTVLHIGCGTFPLTEIMLAKTCQSQIIGIDNRSPAITQAQRYLQKHNLTETIHIIAGDGTCFNYSDYTIIIISSCASPKTAIIDSILTTATPDTRIILRELDINAKAILSYIQQIKKIAVLDHMTHHPFPFIKPFGWNSYFLQIKSL